MANNDRYVPIRSVDNDNNANDSNDANDKGNDIEAATSDDDRPMFSRRCRTCTAVILVAIGAITALIVTQLMLPASESRTDTVYIVMNATIWTG
jgi:hypothetical protein